ncbi:MAG: hypothetical protein ABIH46_06855 [Chloroflexota bacterium]
MAHAHGTDAVFSMASTTLTDYLDSIDPTFDRELAEMRHLGASYVTGLAGLRMGSFSISGDFDPTFDSAIYTAWNASTRSTWTYSPQGTQSADVKYTGYCWVRSYKPGPAGSGDVVKASFDLAATSTISRTTW